MMIQELTQIPLNVGRIHSGAHFRVMRIGSAELMQNRMVVKLMGCTIQPKIIRIIQLFYAVLLSQAVRVSL